MQYLFQHVSESNHIDRIVHVLIRKIENILTPSFYEALAEKLTSSIWRCISNSIVKLNWFSTSVWCFRFNMNSSAQSGATHLCSVNSDIIQKYMPDILVSSRNARRKIDKSNKYLFNKHGAWFVCCELHLYTRSKAC